MIKRYLNKKSLIIISGALLISIIHALTKNNDKIFTFLNTFQIIGVLLIGLGFFIFMNNKGDFNSLKFRKAEHAVLQDIDNIKVNNYSNPYLTSGIIIIIVGIILQLFLY